MFFLIYLRLFGLLFLVFVKLFNESLMKVVFCLFLLFVGGLVLFKFYCVLPGF